MDNALARLARLNPFKTPDARRLALLFAVVYLAQGTWYLPNQTITITLKDAGLGAGQVATFFAITTAPWVIKPVYGLVSDFVPLFGRRRKSYFLLTTALAAAAGAWLALTPGHPYWWLAALFTLMGVGVAFTDVLTDALMVQSGKPLGLTGAFQAVQWAAISVATILTGVVGGYFAERRDLHSVFALATCFPLVSFAMAWLFVREPRERGGGHEAFAQTWAAIRVALRERDLWIVAGFIFFWAFSPSFGTALLYYQTDRLGLSQQFIGYLSSATAAGGVVGALLYAPLSRRLPMRRLIQGAVVVGTLATLLFLLYRGARSAMVIEPVYGCLAMMTLLAFLDLAAKACPRRVEATFFALLMSVYNLGGQASQVVGGYLYDGLGYEPLILVSAAMTAFAWALVPFVAFERIEARARETGA
ncbi:MAG: MFS transporter [Candidatus Rokuibacteriota bacterium]